MDNTTRHLLRSLLLIGLTVLCLGIGGCGQKGDLYLPDDHQSQQG